MYLILGKQLVQSRADSIISLSLGQDWSCFPVERTDRRSFGAALVPGSRLVSQYQQFSCPVTGTWPSFPTPKILSQNIILWFIAESTASGQCPYNPQTPLQPPHPILHLHVFLQRVKCCLPGVLGREVETQNKVKTIMNCCRNEGFWSVNGGQYGLRPKKSREVSCRAEQYQSTGPVWPRPKETDLSCKSSDPSTHSSSQGQLGGATWAPLNCQAWIKHMENLRMGKRHRMSL